MSWSKGQKEKNKVKADSPHIHGLSPKALVAVFFPSQKV